MLFRLRGNMQILVNLVSPAINKDFDMLLPSETPVCQVREIILDNLYEISEGLYQPTGDEVLIHRQANKVLRPNLTLEEENVRNGHSIYII